MSLPPAFPPPNRRTLNSPSTSNVNLVSHDSSYSTGPATPPVNFSSSAAWPVNTLA
jgi:hypothetical protein